MSNGPFSNGFYESDTGIVHPIKFQPETASAVLGGETNLLAPSTGEGVTKSRISAKTSKSKRALGLGARTVSIKYGIGADAYPDGYKPGTTLTIPVFIKSTWDGLTPGDTATYLGKIGTITGLSPESIR